MEKQGASTPRFGRHPRVRGYGTPRLRDYVTAKLPSPPAAFSALPRVFDNSGSSEPGC